MRGRFRAQRLCVGVPDAGPAQEADLHARHHRVVPGRRFGPDARTRTPGHQRLHQPGLERRVQERLRADQPVLRRRAAAAVGVRAGHHALHHREHHHPAARRGDPALRSAEEGRPVRPAEADAVQPLPDHRSGHPAVDRLHRPGQERAAVPELHQLDPLPRRPVPPRHDGHHDDGRHRGHHVAGRADHRPRASATACRS